MSVTLSNTLSYNLFANGYVECTSQFLRFDSRIFIIHIRPKAVIDKELQLCVNVVLNDYIQYRFNIIAVCKYRRDSQL